MTIFAIGYNQITTNAMIRLNVFIQVGEENRAALIEAAKKLVAASLNDEGCIAYDLFASATRADVFMICETWATPEALAKHENSAHFTTLVPEMERLGSLKLEKFNF